MFSVLMTKTNTLRFPIPKTIRQAAEAIAPRLAHLRMAHQSITFISSLSLFHGFLLHCTPTFYKCSLTGGEEIWSRDTAICRMSACKREEFLLEYNFGMKSLRHFVGVRKGMGWKENSKAVIKTEGFCFFEHSELFLASFLGLNTANMSLVNLNHGQIYLADCGSWYPT